MSFLQQARELSTKVYPVERSARGHLITPHKNAVKQSIPLARQASIGLQMLDVIDVSDLPTPEESFMFKVARIQPESKYALVRRWLDITDENIARAVTLGELYDRYLST